MKRHLHLDHQLRSWKYDPHTLSVRLVKGADGRDLIQMRIDLGILQLETSGRPDGSMPEGFETFLDRLTARELDEPDFELSEEECAEVDREFMQFYHRRICWLRLQRYRRAVIDADHTLRLMDISTLHSPDDEWAQSHEQYRHFVLFHRTQAEALVELEENGAEEAVEAVNHGLDDIRAFYELHEAEEQFDTDELVVRLVELRESLRREYFVGRTLAERLADAVQSEQYELAAELRDELNRRQAS